MPRTLKNQIVFFHINFLVSSLSFSLQSLLWHGNKTTKYSCNYLEIKLFCNNIFFKILWVEGRGSFKFSIQETSSPNKAMPQLIPSLIFKTGSYASKWRSFMLVIKNLNIFSQILTLYHYNIRKSSVIIIIFLRGGNSAACV